MTAQQLVKQRAVRVPVKGGAQAGGDVKQFNAVTDSHLSDRASLGGHDHADTRQRLLAGLQPDPALPA